MGCLRGWFGGQRKPRVTTPRFVLSIFPISGNPHLRIKAPRDFKSMSTLKSIRSKKKKGQVGAIYFPLFTPSPWSLYHNPTLFSNVIGIGSLILGFLHLTVKRIIFSPKLWYFWRRQVHSYWVWWQESYVVRSDLLMELLYTLYMEHGAQFSVRATI